MKKLYKFIAVALATGLVASSVSAADLISTDTNTVSVTGSLRLATGTNDFRELEGGSDHFVIVDNGSRIRFSFENKDLQNLTVGAYTEWGFSSQNTRSEDFLTNRYGAIYFQSPQYGKVTIGKFFSLIADYTVDRTTDWATYGALDSGLYAGILGISNEGKVNERIELLGNNDGNQYGVLRATNAVGYEFAYNNIAVALQFQGHNKAYNDGKVLVSENPDLVDRKYAAGVAVKYEDEKYLFSVAYQRVQQEWVGNTNETPVARPEFLSKEALNANIALVAAAANVVEGLRVGVSGGYYQNLHALDLTSMGASAYVEYTFREVFVPFAGYNILVSDAAKNAQSTAKIFGKDWNYDYDLMDSTAVLGIKYNVSDRLWLSYEFNQDLRSKRLRDQSFTPSSKTQSVVGIRYNF